MKIGFALALALASAIALNWGYVAQHGAASTLPPLSLRRPIASLRTLFGHRRWLVGFIVGIAGWVLYVAALRLAPLSLVQATSAGGIAVLALLVPERLTRAEHVGVLVAMAGLLVLAVSLTGSRSSCVSARGAFDMVGNLDEWVADWVPLSTSCLSWSGFSNDFMCLAGANENANGPGALLRGGTFNDGTFAGPVAVDDVEPFRAAAVFGFRCGR